MNRRSRKGCKDCKKAKIKCDEVRPACGTCSRRGYVCQGYANPPLRDTSGADHKLLSGRSKTREGDQKKSNRRSSDARDCQSPASDSDGETTSLFEQVDKKPRTLSTSSVCATNRRLSTISRSSNGKSSPYPLCLRFPIIPPGTIQSSDEPGIETYFIRHPTEVVISAEFVDEMNANVLQVFHEDPATVAETLSAIGHIYLGEGGKCIVPFLDRRARIIARLRDKNEFEQKLMMHLGLCALELIDARILPEDTGIPDLIANAAIIIKHNFDSGHSFSSIAKYFIRALARQDMIISLTYAHRPLISSQVWLDDDFHRQADRFMGYTGPLMPILAEIGTLAEEIRATNSVATPFICQNEDTWMESSLILGPSSQGLSIFQKAKAKEVRARLDQWRPVAAPNITFQSSKNLLFHAHAYKAASILYLHRLLEQPGSSEEADQTALSMAHEVLMHLSALTDQVKTALWPAFIAGTELVDGDDRNVVLQIFDEIYQQRKTITALRTKEFCVDRVWNARDLGLHWFWMDLVHQFPGECLPI